MKELNPVDNNAWDLQDIGLDEYQEEAANFAFYSGFIYPTLGLVGEAGEIAEKVKKLLRDKEMPADHDLEEDDKYLTEDERADLVLECGDVLWYLANLSNDLGFCLSEVAQLNLSKLQSRRERGKLKGSGDNR